MKILPPLKAEHPITVDGTVCPICKETFKPMQRTVLIPVRGPLIPGQVEMCPAICVHADCACKGTKTKCGVIKRILDGDGSPFPVITEDGCQWKFSDVGLEGD